MPQSIIKPGPGQTDASQTAGLDAKKCFINVTNIFDNGFLKRIDLFIHLVFESPVHELCLYR